MNATDAPIDATAPARSAPAAPTIHRWERLTKRAFEEIDRERAVVLLTVSPLEVHGPHLPLGTDVFEGEGLLERSIARLPAAHVGRPFLKLPFLWTAADTLPQAGSVDFRSSTVVAAVEDVARSLSAQGFRHLLVSNFHGGPRHVVALEAACDRANRRGKLQAIPVFSVLLRRLVARGQSFDGLLGSLPGVEKGALEGDVHGGYVETSQILALHRDLVDAGWESLPVRTLDRWLAERGEAPAFVAPDRRTGGRALLRSMKANVRFFATESYAGAPGPASAEAGEQILGLLSGIASEAIADALDGKLGPADLRSPLWRIRHFATNGFLSRIASKIVGHRMLRV